jgi:hypothetical protein
MKKSELKNLLLADLERNKKDLKEHELLKESLKDQDGKPFTKHFEKKLPDGWKLNIRYGLIQTGKPPKENQHLLGWVSNGGFNLSDFDRANSANCEGSKSRINQLEYWLMPENFNELHKAYSKLSKAFETVYNTVKNIEDNKMGSFHLPIHYELLKEIGLPDRLFSNIVYSKNKKDIKEN